MENIFFLFVLRKKESVPNFFLFTYHLQYGYSKELKIPKKGWKNANKCCKKKKTEKHKNDKKK